MQNGMSVLDSLPVLFDPQRRASGRYDAGPVGRTLSRR
jgi:hypothetical protein